MGEDLAGGPASPVPPSGGLDMGCRTVDPGEVGLAEKGNFHQPPPYPTFSNWLKYKDA